MIIAVNTRLLLSGKLEGIGWFTYEVLKRITINNPQHTFIFIFDRPFSTEFIFAKNIVPVVAFPPSRHPLLWYIWFNFSIPRILRKYKADLFFSPDGFLSLYTSIKQVPVIHDLNFEHYPKDLPFSHSLYYRKFFRKYAKIAYKIGTVSNYSKNDIVEKYNIQSNKITVVYNGVNTGFKPIAENEKIKIKEKYSSGNDYFLFVGALHARKNIARLIEAFTIFKNQNQNSVKLVLAGNKKWWTAEMDKVLNSSPFKNEIIFTGRIRQEDLFALMGGALALTYVPYFEGFGIPVIEAMRAGTPVITSNTSCLPEITLNNALLINPFRVTEIADAMLQIYNFPEKRENLICKGLNHAQNFSWDYTAKLVENLLDLKDN